jgi:hypothetical protein
MQAPTGKDDVRNDVPTSPAAAAPTPVTADYSIQPGQRRAGHGL